MPIRSHKVDGIPYRAARWMGPVMAPEIVILHDTASRLAPGAAAGWLRDNPAQVSVHFVVERDGAVEQQVPTNRTAHHAGASWWQGREGCNRFSIGIELVSPGRLSPGRAGRARAWYGEEFDIAENGIVRCRTPVHGEGLWMPYPEPQIEALLGLLATLFRGVPTLDDITTHWHVSPGRKIDTGPLFPLDAVRARILGRDDPGAAMAEAASLEAGADNWAVVRTDGDVLNLRAWPSFNPNVIRGLPHDAIVQVLRRGTFDGRDWLRVRYGASEGWVVARFTRPHTQRQS